MNAANLKTGDRVVATRAIGKWKHVAAGTLGTVVEVVRYPLCLNELKVQFDGQPCVDDLGSIGYGLVRAA
jgi:hypothetical protein